MNRRKFLQGALVATAGAGVVGVSVPVSAGLFKPKKIGKIRYEEQYKVEWLWYIQSWWIDIGDRTWMYNRITDVPFNDLPYEHREFILLDCYRTLGKAIKENS